LAPGIFLFSVYFLHTKQLSNSGSPGGNLSFYLKLTLSDFFAFRFKRTYAIRRKRKSKSKGSRSLGAAMVKKKKVCLTPAQVAEERRRLTLASSGVSGSEGTARPVDTTGNPAADPGTEMGSDLLTDAAVEKPAADPGTEMGESTPDSIPETDATVETSSADPAVEEGAGALKTTPETDAAADLASEPGALDQEAIPGTIAVADLATENKGASTSTLTPETTPASGTPAAVPAAEQGAATPKTTPETDEVPPEVSYATHDNREIFGSEHVDVGGLAFELEHGSVLIECAKFENHATTALREPDRRSPTRIGVVFYQHRGLSHPHHGGAELKRRTRTKMEGYYNNMRNGLFVPTVRQLKVMIDLGFRFPDRILVAAPGKPRDNFGHELPMDVVASTHGCFIVDNPTLRRKN
jgi:hypothetical protein